MKLNQVILGKDVFIAPSATVIGDVSLKDNASVWFGDSIIVVILKASMSTSLS